MSSNATVTRIAHALAEVWSDLMSEDFRAEVSAETRRIAIVEDAESLGLYEEAYALATRIFNGTN